MYLEADVINLQKEKRNNLACYTLLYREVLVDFRSSYVTHLSINTKHARLILSHMFPRLHCNSLFDTGVTYVLQRSIKFGGYKDEVKHTHTLAQV